MSELVKAVALWKLMPLLIFLGIAALVGLVLLGLWIDDRIRRRWRKWRKARRP